MVYPFVVINSISGVLTLILFVYALVKKETFAFRRAFLMMIGFSVIYIFGHVFELESQSVAEVMFWVKFQYAGLAFIAPTSMVVVLQYVGLERFLKKKRFLAFYLIPAITLILCWTNEWHHLFYQSVIIRPDTDVHLVDFEAGPWYIVHGSYTFGLLIMGILILIWYLHQTKSVYWRQILIMIISFALPMISAFLYLMGFSPYGMDPVPSVMFITSLLYFRAIVSTQFFKIAPIARNQIFESMRDGVLVLNHSLQITDFNRAAAQIVDGLNRSSIGKRVEEIYPIDLVKHLGSMKSEEYEVEWNKGQTYYHIKTTPLMKNGMVVGYSIIFSDITSQKQIEERLKEMAYYDGLTGIYNRAHFLEKSEAQLQRTIETGEPLSLILFDIDNFKKVNDTFGHIIGDLAICHVVSLSEKLLQPPLIFGRFGGEEFIACLPGENSFDACLIAETLRRELATHPLITDLFSQPITASFGVAEYKPTTDTLTSLIQRADHALYQSKEMGKNQVSMR